MTNASTFPARQVALAFPLLVTLASVAFAIVLPVQRGFGQEPDVPVDAETIESLMQQPPPPPEPERREQPSGIDLLSLIVLGGNFMIPIGLMSMLVVALGVERTLSLRRKRIMPAMLVDDLEDLCNPLERFNPAVALAICRDHPSPTATVVEAMLMRTGQPLAEIEHAAHEAIQREADDCAAPIRWLSLASSATPLMGLLGTVWGMIVAFHESTTLTADRSRSEQLSAGIYAALVTTLAGLIVAIPAAILAQYLENRLAKLFHNIERFAFDLAPGLSRFAGRSRLDVDGSLRPMTVSTPPNAVSGPPVQPPAATATPPPPATTATAASLRVKR